MPAHIKTSLINPFGINRPINAYILKSEEDDDFVLGKTTAYRTLAGRESR